MNRIPDILMWISGLSHAFLVFIRCWTVILASTYIAIRLIQSQG